MPRAYPAKLYSTRAGECRECGIRLSPVGIEDNGLCVLCDTAADLAYAGDARAGVMIWMPEATQAELNRMVAAAIVMLADADTAGVAKGFLDLLEDREKALSSAILDAHSVGAPTFATDPLLFYQYGVKNDIGVRFFPRPGYFRGLFDVIAEKGSLVTGNLLKQEIELVRGVRP